MAEVEEFVDTRGLMCPEPLIIVRNRIREMTLGQRIRITATDPSTQRDFANLCRFAGHEMIESSEANGTYEFVIQKG